MFKIKQILKLDDKFNVVRCEEYHDNELMYYEINKYDYKNRVLERETEEMICYFESYPHIKCVKKMICKYITIDIGFTKDLNIASLD